MSRFSLVPFVVLRRARVRWSLRCSLLLLIPMLVSGTPADSTSSEWSVQAWRYDDGLPHNHVTGLAQTPDGYLWVATYSSLARFDGIQFEEHLPKNLGLGSNQKISALAHTRDGGLWIGLLHGKVVRLASEGLQAFIDELPYKPVQALVGHSDGSMWVTHQGGTVARIKDGKLTSFDVAQGLPAATAPNRYVCSLASSIDGRLWFSKDGHVGIFRDEQFVTLLRLRPLNATIARASRGGVWICSEGQLMRLEESAGPERHGAFKMEAPTLPTALLEDRRGGVWIGTSDNGLFYYDGRQIRSVPTSDSRISSLAEDRNGNIWVGTTGGGLNRVRPRFIALENESTGLPGMVQSLAEDAAGTLWATTQSGQLLRRIGTEWFALSNEPSWPGGRASCVIADETGAVWIGTRDHALHRWKDGVFTSIRRAEGIGGREVRCLSLSRNGDLWIAFSSPSVVQRLRDDQLESFETPQDIRVIRAMAEDTAGNLWLGTSKGMLLRIRGGVLTDETRRTTGAPLSIRILRAMPDGGLWIGYADEGVGWWKDEHFAHLTTANGFPENNVSQIIADSRGWLWFAGDHGIFKVRQQALEDLALRRTERAHFIHDGPSEGLLSLEANFGDSPGALRTRDGRLWIPMRTALAVVDPSRSNHDRDPPSVLLRRVVVDDQVVAAYGGSVPVRGAIDLRDASSTLRLPPGHHRLAIDFTAPNFDAPDNVRFRHRLEGFDSHWIEAGTQRSATYSRLASGNYRFRVQACNSEGVWAQHGATLAFTVPPVWWQRWWFRLGAFLAFTSATIVIVRAVSLRRVRERMRRLEQQAVLHNERVRIARDLHDEFGTRLTELGLMAELDRKQGVPSTDFIGSIRSLERDLDTIVWVVDPKNDTLDQLVGFVCRVCSEFLARMSIRCRFDIPDELPPRPLTHDLRHNLFLVTREAVNNVVKHASATEVKIAVAVEEDLLRFRIENDGRGFALADAGASGRNGLKNMRSRIEEIGGSFRVESSPDLGTAVEFCVPLGAAATHASATVPHRG